MYLHCIDKFIATKLLGYTCLLIWYKPSWVITIQIPSKLEVLSFCCSFCCFVLFVSQSVFSLVYGWLLCVYCAFLLKALALKENTMFCFDICIFQIIQVRLLLYILCSRQHSLTIVYYFNNWFLIEVFYNLSYNIDRCLCIEVRYQLKNNTETCKDGLRSFSVPGNFNDSTQQSPNVITQFFNYSPKDHCAGHFLARRLKYVFRCFLQGFQS